jgi:type VI protein secretion system component Hcp
MVHYKSRAIGKAGSGGQTVNSTILVLRTTSDVGTNAGLFRLTLQNEALAYISNSSPSSSPLPLTMNEQ